MRARRSSRRATPDSVEALAYAEVMNRVESDRRLDPRCNYELYQALMAAAKLVQQNEYEKARETALEALGVVHGTV